MTRKMQKTVWFKLQTTQEGRGEDSHEFAGFELALFHTGAGQNLYPPFSQINLKLPQSLLKPTHNFYIF